MTALPDAKREALRFRIWQFCQPREWNVTIADIADELAEPAGRVRMVLRHAGWSSRVRVQSPTEGLSRWRSDVSISTGGVLTENSRHIVRDVLAGRVNSEFTA